MIKLTPISLLSTLGSFWTSVFTSANLIKQVVLGQLRTHSQSEQAVTELVKSAANAEIPAGVTTTWQKMVFSIYNQEKETYQANGGTYGGSYFYGEVANNHAVYDIDLDIIALPLLYNHPVTPTKVLVEGIDYKLQPGKLILRTAFSYTDATTLYARNVVRESGFVTERMGHILDVQLADQVYAKVPFKYIWRLYTYGPNYLDLMLLLGACSNTPIAKVDEVVELISAFGPITMLTTNKNVYAMPTNKALNLKLGSTLRQGSPVTNGIIVLHDKNPSIGLGVPQVYRSERAFNYGSVLANGTALTIIKADISGAYTAALKVLKYVLPAEIKVLIFTNIDIPAAAVSEAHFSLQYSITSSVRALPVTVGNSQMSLKAKAKVKHTYSGC